MPIMPTHSAAAAGRKYRFEYDIFCLPSGDSVGCLAVYDLDGKFIHNLAASTEDADALSSVLALRNMLPRKALN
jgi:hypothetical protein